MTALTQISNLLVTLNSSVNFIIYCIYGDKFKRLFCYIFCKKCGGAREENLQMLQRYPTTTTIRGRQLNGTSTGMGGGSSIGCKSSINQRLQTSSSMFRSKEVRENSVNIIRLYLEGKSIRSLLSFSLSLLRERELVCIIRDATEAPGTP